MRKTIRHILVGLGAGAVFAGPAMAVEVKETVEVDGKPAEIWAKIGGWCAIKDWHPALAGCTASKEGGADWRLLTTKDGGKIKEKRTAVGQMSYSYTITESPLPVANYNATFAVRADDGDTEIVWTATFDAKGASDADAKKVIQGIFEAGLGALDKAY